MWKHPLIKYPQLYQNPPIFFSKIKIIWPIHLQNIWTSFYQVLIINEYETKSILSRITLYEWHCSVRDTVRYISFSRGKKQKGDTRAKSKRDKNIGTFFVLWTGTLWHASKQSNFKPVHMSGSTAHDVAET